MTITTATEPRSEALKAALHAIFTTACEGGISYWAWRQQYVWTKPTVPGSPELLDDVDNFYAVIKEDEPSGSGDDAKRLKHRIDIDTIEKGLRLLGAASPCIKGGSATTSTGMSWQDFAVEVFALQDNTDPDSWLDCPDYDAGDADTIVQAGLFGETIYG